MSADPEPPLEGAWEPGPSQPAIRVVPNFVGEWSEARTETRLQGTWVVHQPDRSTTGMWCVDGNSAVFPMQNERPFVVHVADDGAISLQRRAEGYHASLQRFENDDYVVWNGGAYWTRLEGEWTAQLDDGSTAHYVVRGREVRWSDGVRRRFGYEESHLVVKIAHEPTAVLEASSDGGEKLEWKQGARRFVWVRLRRDAREALEAPLRALFSEHAARLGAAGGDPDALAPSGAIKSICGRKGWFVDQVRF